MSDCDADCEDMQKIGQGRTLEEAIDIAQKYQLENIVEYGIRFTEEKQGRGKGEKAEQE